MSDDESIKASQAAFKQLKPKLESMYPKFQFVAFCEGKIIADAPDFDGIVDLIFSRGGTRDNSVVVRVGDYLTNAAIL